MAKTGLTGGSGQTPPIFANPGSVFRRGKGGILPERGSRAQYDMVQQLLQSGLASSQQSGSPLLAFLAPMLGGAVGARTEGLYRDAQGKRNKNAIDQLLEAMGTGRTGTDMTGGAQPQDSRRSSIIDQMFPVGKEGAVPRGNVDPATGLHMGKTVPSRDEMSSYIMQSAQRRGIDPQTALKVAASEGLNADPNEAWQSQVVKDGKRERSYGPFQLYIDGGLGNEFMNDTGLDPRDPSTWQAQVDYALDHASKNGWGAWYGARNVGLDDWAGISPSGGGSGGGSVRTAQAGGMNEETMRVLMSVIGNDSVNPAYRDIAGGLLEQAMKPPEQMTPQERVDYQKSVFDLRESMEPPGEWRVATPEEAATYGASGGQFGPDGRFYPSRPGQDDRNSEAAIMRQQRELAVEVESQIKERMLLGGLDRNEAVIELARDPIWGGRMRDAGVDPAKFTRRKVIEDAAPAEQSDPGWWGRLFGGGENPPNDPAGIR